MREHDLALEGRDAPARSVDADGTMVEHGGRVEDEVLTACASFQIRAADTERGRSKARILVERLYATRGYRTTLTAPFDLANRMTLVATDAGRTIGTLSVRFDGDEGLAADDLFRAEADALRADGRQLCEFTKLAVDTSARSREVLASLFHVAYLFAHRLGGYRMLLIEVNPRHVDYYERMLGFRALAPERLNRRVNAPALLLGLDFRHAAAQIARLAGLRSLASGERSLYPWFFSAAEEKGILHRLRDTS
jgi:hypothetical protein